MTDTSTQAIQPDVSVASESCPVGLPGACTARLLLRTVQRPIPFTITLAAVTVLLFAAYGRIGTTANAGEVITFERLRPGFVAVGLTDNQPGFMLLSRLKEEEVDVHANLIINRVSGRRTRVSVTAGDTTWSNMLRGPRMILVHEDGSIEDMALAWTYAQLAAACDAMNCDQTHDGTHRRCGQPMADLVDFIHHHDLGVPDEASAFLATALD